MAINSVPNLVEVLRDSQILEGFQLEEVVHKLQPQFSDPQLLADELIEWSWLTRFQVKELFQGNGQRLVLGQYIMLEPAGEGGMGQVFKARHRSLGRVVALKMIRPDLLSDLNVLDRFHREVRAAAQLIHPNIVMAHDAGQVGRIHFLVTEYVEGTNLEKLVRRNGPLAVPLACDYVRQPALGLQHAFEQGVTHRDIKPSNLMLSKDSVVKLLDMGLARTLAVDFHQPTTADLSWDGTTVGTPGFMSPEQAVDARDVDVRSDLYSLGCTF